jgi:hypothetical protein
LRPMEVDVRGAVGGTRCSSLESLPTELNVDDLPRRIGVRVGEEWSEGGPPFALKRAMAGFS